MSDHKKILEEDLKEATSFKEKIKVHIKVVVHAAITFFWNLYVENKKKEWWGNNKITEKTDSFLRNEGGMFKTRVYKICSQVQPIRNSRILVPGAGYGHNILQLARLKPKEIICLDLYKYPEEWDFIKKEAKKLFNVNVFFLRGNMPDILEEYKSAFDWIISDAVLEHVRDMDEFMQSSNILLKDGGMFYASFGPLWYGPGGDHLSWKERGLFFHVTADQEEYEEEFNKNFNDILEDSCDGKFLVQEKLFSYLKSNEYFNSFHKNGFEGVKLFSKISTRAIKEIKKYPDVENKLNFKNIPRLDRYCSGFYVWMKKNECI